MRWVMTNLRRNLLVLSVGVLVAGCTSAGPKRLDTATASVDETRTLLDEGAEQMNTVVASLRTMQSSTDLAASFKAYSKELKELEDISEDVRARRAAMATRMQDHIDEWNQELSEISNPETRQVSAKRQQEFVTAFQRLGSAMDELKADYAPLVSNLRDIELVMANDLSRAGLEIANPIIDEVIKQAEAVHESVRKCNTALADAIATFRR